MEEPEIRINKDGVLHFCKSVSVRCHGGQRIEYVDILDGTLVCTEPKDLCRKRLSRNKSVLKITVSSFSK